MKTYLELAVDALGPLVALIGIFATLPIIKKKLLENHVVAILNKIQESNSQIRIQNQKIIDKYLPIAYNPKKLSKSDCENILIDLEKSLVLSETASYEVATLMFYLNLTLIRIKLEYAKLNQSLNTDVLLVFVIDVLDTVNFYSRQVVPIPQSVKTHKRSLIKKPMRKFYTDAHILKYRQFKIGVNNNSHSALYAIFTNKANETGDFVIKRRITYKVSRACL